MSYGSFWDNAFDDVSDDDLIGFLSIWSRDDTFQSY